MLDVWNEDGSLNTKRLDNVVREIPEMAELNGAYTLEQRLDVLGFHILPMMAQRILELEARVDRMARTVVPGTGVTVEGLTPKRRNPLTYETYLKVQAMKDSGHTTKAISVQLDLPYSTVVNYIKLPAERVAQLKGIAEGSIQPQKPFTKKAEPVLADKADNTHAENVMDDVAETVKATLVAKETLVGLDEDADVLAQIQEEMESATQPTPPQEPSVDEVPGWLADMPLPGDPIEQPKAEPDAPVIDHDMLTRAAEARGETPPVQPVQPAPQGFIVQCAPTPDMPGWFEWDDDHKLWAKQSHEPDGFPLFRPADRGTMLRVRFDTGTVEILCEDVDWTRADIRRFMIMW